MHQHMRRSRRTILATSVVLVGLATASCGSSPRSEQSTSVPTPASDAAPAGTAGTSDTTDSGEPVIVSAAEGLAARNQVPVRGGGAGESELAASTGVAADSMMIDPGMGCGVYEPSAEEIAAANGDHEALAAELDRYGVAYERTTDDLGFVQINTDPLDIVAQAVSQSFWTARYPPEAISEEALAAQVAQNDIIAAELDAAGVHYTRTTDEQGFESIQYEFDDPAAQEAVDAAWLIISPPQPPDPETLATITAENDALAAAFDAAAVEYQRFADELGWQWLEWNYEDQTINDIATSVYEQLYPPIVIDPIDQCVAVDVMADGVATSEPMHTEPVSDDAVADDAVADDAVADDAVADDAVADDVAAVDPAAPSVVEETVEVLPIEVVDELSADDIARRDAEVAAMVDGFTDAGVSFVVEGDSPWQSVIFDLTNDAGVAVVQAIIAGRS